jgi:hypothetical protein
MSVEKIILFVDIKGTVIPSDGNYTGSFAD